MVDQWASLPALSLYICLKHGTIKIKQAGAREIRDVSVTETGINPGRAGSRRGHILKTRQEKKNDLVWCVAAKASSGSCLLYTSDAADDWLVV